jgi:hypothetical protein
LVRGWFGMGSHWTGRSTPRADTMRLRAMLSAQGAECGKGATWSRGFTGSASVQGGGPLIAPMMRTLIHRRHLSATSIMPTSGLCRPLAQNGLWRRRSVRRSRHNPIDLKAHGLFLPIERRLEGGPLPARSRLIPQSYFMLAEELPIALSGPSCTSSIGLCRRYSGSYRSESSFSDTGRHNLEVGIMKSVFSAAARPRRCS